MLLLCMPCPFFLSISGSKQLVTSISGCAAAAAACYSSLPATRAALCDRISYRFLAS